MNLFKKNRSRIIPLVILAFTFTTTVALFQNCAESFEVDKFAQNSTELNSGSPEPTPEPNTGATPPPPSSPTTIPRPAATPTPTPAPGSTPTPGATPTPTPAPLPGATPTPTPVPAPGATPTPNPAPTPPAPAVYSKINRLVAARGARSMGVIQTQDLGFLTGGVSNSSTGGSGDGIITKWNELGDRVWTTEVKGTAALGDGDDRFFDVVEVSDGYIAAGMSASFKASSPTKYGDVNLTKVDKQTGRLLWTRLIGTDQYWDYAFDIDLYNDPTTGPALIMAADTGLTKLNLSGDVVWVRSLDGFRVQSVVHIAGRGFAAVGGSYIAIFDYSGQLLSLRSVTGASFYGIEIGRDNQLYVTGSAGSAPPFKGLIVKATLDGNITQQVTLSGGSSLLHGIAPLKSGGVVIFGPFSLPNSSVTMGAIIKIRPDLTVEFAKTLAGTGISFSGNSSIIQRADGGLAVSGGLSSGQLLVLTDQYGKVPANCSVNQSDISLTVTQANLPVVSAPLPATLERQLRNQTVTPPDAALTSTNENLCQ